MTDPSELMNPSQEKAEDHPEEAVMAASEAGTPEVAASEAEIPVVAASAAVETPVVVASAAETLEVVALEAGTPELAAVVAVEMMVIAYLLAVSHTTALKMLPDHTFKRFSPMLQMFVFHQTKIIRAK